MSIRNIDRYFLFSSITFAIAGMLLGISMGMNEDFSFAAVHAHINLVGFVSLALLASRTGSDGRQKTTGRWRTLRSAEVAQYCSPPESPLSSPAVRR